jgi:hypothetical protein
MKKALLSMAALGAIAVAAPAAGQAWSQNGDVYARGGASAHDRIARLEARIDAGVQAGTIDRREARDLRYRLREITRLERRYSRNGLSQQERADLQARLRAFREELRLAGGAGYGNGRYGAYEPDDGYYGQGGPYEQCYDDDRSQSGGLGGIIDSIFGGGNDRDDDCGATLRVGQRVSGNLYAVPAALRYRFRDGGGVYYRSDGRAVYQIDARTHVVLRIYDMDD